MLEPAGLFRQRNLDVNEVRDVLELAVGACRAINSKLRVDHCDVTFQYTFFSNHLMN